LIEKSANILATGDDQKFHVHCQFGETVSNPQADMERSEFPGNEALWVERRKDREMKFR